MGIVNNPSAQPSTIDGQNRNQVFTYDDNARLVTATGTGSALGAWQRRFAYDRWGKGTGMWDATSGGNQIQSVGLQLSGGVPTNRFTSVTNSGNTSNYVYDATGNVTSDGVHTYQYDGEGRLAKVDAGSANESSYFYDANNWRVKKVVGTGGSAVTTNYIWEGAVVIAEYSSAGPQGSGGTRYYHADRLSTRLITDGNGVVVGAEDHLPFGEDAGVTGESEKHRFTNYERDVESGTDQTVNRQHQSTNGRFMQPDVAGGSIGDPQSLNRYAYSLNDPGNVTDPSGLDPIVHFPNLTPPPQFDASNPGPGLYLDGIRVEPNWYRFVFGILESGAGVIAPIGAKAYLGAGGATFVTVPGYYTFAGGTTPDGGVWISTTFTQTYQVIEVGLQQDYREWHDYSISSDPYFVSFRQACVTRHGLA